MWYFFTVHEVCGWGEADSVAQLEGGLGSGLLPSQKLCHKFNKPLQNYWMSYLFIVWILSNLTGGSLFNLNHTKGQFLIHPMSCLIRNVRLMQKSHHCKQLIHCHVALCLWIVRTLILFLFSLPWYLKFSISYWQIL